MKVKATMRYYYTLNIINLFKLAMQSGVTRILHTLLTRMQTYSPLGNLCGRILSS